MRLKLYALSMIILFAAFGCQSSQQKKVANDPDQRVVQEVLQANSYTYLNLKGNDKSYWVAIPKKEVKVGDKVYHSQGLEMTNFKSKDLQRTFATVYFLSGVSSEPIGSAPAQASSAMMKGKHTGVAKKDVSVQAIENGITVAELFANRDQYANKTVKIRGQVVKFNAGIMGKNWAHIQDGTDNDGNYDITITTNANVKVDDIVTFEGKISLNKDFGAGYSYEVIMEDANKLN